MITASRAFCPGQKSAVPIILATFALLAAGPVSADVEDDDIFTFFKTEKLEYQRDNKDSFFVWDAEGWIGEDKNKLWLKTEGEYVLDVTQTERAELQVLYSRFIFDFWDAQVGIRDEFQPNQTLDAVLGVQGLAPYWFEVDAAVFLSQDADVLARLKASYEFLFTQKLILQPQIELNFAAQDVSKRDYKRGLSELEAGLRLRYEIIREVAPYVGLEYVRDEAAESDKNSLRFVTGVRVWF